MAGDFKYNQRAKADNSNKLSINDTTYFSNSDLNFITHESPDLALQDANIKHIEYSKTYRRYCEKSKFGGLLTLKFPPTQILMAKI